MPPRRSTRKTADDPSLAADSTTAPAAAPAAVATRRSTRKAAAVATNPAEKAALPPTTTATSSKARTDANTISSALVDSSATTAKAPVSKAKAPKPKSKRTIPDEDDGVSKPASKKAKKAAKDDPDDAPILETPKIVTILKRGAAPTDPFSPYVSTHQVYVSPDGEIWDAMLNQTNIGKNANKFYVIQLLHPISNASACLLFVRWGRTGENGATQTKGPWPPAQAINEFKKQFRSKTSTPWEQRHGMAAKSGKYTWLERDFETPEKDDKDEGSSHSKDKGKEKVEPEKVPDSVLPAEVQNLCRLIFNASFIDAALSSMNYDANKLPLGKLSKATILKGFAALKSLSEVVENANKTTQYGAYDNACSELSGQYYSIIPHVFGRNKPTVINTMIQLKRELELVDALGDMEIAQKLISDSIDRDSTGEPINPLDARFKSLALESMIPVTNSSKEFAALAAYAKDTHGSTHNYYKVTLETAFRVKRSHEDENWSNAGLDVLEEGQRLLLWHGSRSTNFAGILSQGLRIAPPEAPVNGYMFGKGVYFADMMSKSYNYCHAHSSGNMGILLLCDVIVKPCYELLDSSYNAGEECKAAGKLATKGIGQIQPVDWQDAGSALDNDDLKGCLMPQGAAKEVNPPGASLMYNEYIVYNTAQIRVKYLLMVRMGN
ncbi:hypothetical protein M0805_000050 [Coniferiporia weirii]|nr:hypothetical protein M0805_000050 [Coniferiporia weirii]